MLERGTDFLTVGFWNIEKKNTVPEEGTFAFESRSSQGFYTVVRTIKRWFMYSKFDILILAEVADKKGKGDQFVEYVANALSKIGFPGRDMQGVFRWSETSSGSISACNFGVIWDNSVEELDSLGYKLDWYWEPDWVRPMIILPAATLVVGGIHAKSARKDLATREIVEGCTYLDKYQNRAVLIGDMNIPFDDFPVLSEAQLEYQGWSNIPPGFGPTHMPHSDKYEPAVLDYIWRNAGATRCVAQPPVNGYNAWDLVDHAPIQYHVAWRAGDLPD